VVGSVDEVASYRQMASLFAPLNRQVTVRVKAWPDEAAMMADLRAGAKPPDVFIASRRDLFFLDQHQLIQPIDQLLEDRGVDFGDDYPRSTLTAFGTDNHLNCLPYGIAPSVIYYNKKLVKLGQVSADPPVPGEGWSLDQFAAAARWVVRHHARAAGAYIEPSLGGVAPFVLSGGGRIFDDDTTPTALTLADGASQQALIRTVRVMHRPGISLSPEQLAEKTPLQWFEEGRLGLLEGSRDIVPALRNRLLFDFDVRPMPPPGGSPACASRAAPSTPARPRTSWSTPPPRRPSGASRPPATSSRPTRRSPSPTTSSSRGGCRNMRRCSPSASRACSTRP
jgi:multiple sugar transport system substrate-binding protein